MKAEDKPKYVKEMRELLASIEIDTLIDDPNNLEILGRISRLIAILTNFSYNDGQELRRLLFEFQKCAKRNTSVGTIRNRATDMLQFISQKIEEMDIYGIEEPIRKKQDKIVKSLKDENLWVQSSLEGKDLHVLIGERNAKEGEHIHLVSDSETGEIRVDADDKTPSELIKRVVSITTKYGSTIGISQYGVKTTMEFIKKEITEDKDMPILYATGIRRSGGPKGYFDYITIKNIGKTIALDIHWGIRAFAYEWRPTEEPFELEPNKEKEVVFPISTQRIFTEVIPELNVIMEYKDADNKTYFTRRELKQVRVTSGAPYELKADTFHPPSILVDDGPRLISEPVRNGDRTEATFKIDTKDGVKEVKIGLSGSLIAVFGFDKDELVKQAILELAHRFIRKMVKTGNITDYCFTTHDLPEHHPGGFEAYVLLRNLVT